MRKLMILLIVALNGCSNTMSDQALRVESINDGEGCESLGMVTGRSPAFALSASDERTGAVNSAYNKVAKLGGNAIVVLNVDRTNFGGGVVQDIRLDDSGRSDDRRQAACTQCVDPRAI